MKNSLPISNEKSFHYSELSYIYDRLKFYDNLRSVTLAFCGTASITIFGFAVSNNNPFIAVIPIPILIYFIIFDRRCRKSIISHYCCAFLILNKIKIEDENTVFHINCTSLSKEARRIVTEYKEPDEIRDAIAHTSIVNKGFFFLIPISALVLEILGVSTWLIVALVKWLTS